jgi:hypothetical protein
MWTSSLPGGDLLANHRTHLKIMLSVRSCLIIIRYGSRLDPARTKPELPLRRGAGSSAAARRSCIAGAACRTSHVFLRVLAAPVAHVEGRIGEDKCQRCGPCAGVVEGVGVLPLELNLIGFALMPRRTRSSLPAAVSSRSTTGRTSRCLPRARRAPRCTPHSARTCPTSRSMVRTRVLSSNRRTTHRGVQNSAVLLAFGAGGLRLEIFANAAEELGEKALQAYLGNEIQEVYRLRGRQYKRQAHRGHCSADDALGQGRGRRPNSRSINSASVRRTSV